MEFLAELKPYLEALLESYEQAANVAIALATFMGGARMVMKPLMELLKAIAKLTKTDADDKAIEAGEKSRAYAVVCFLADYILSIKLPGRK